MKLNRNFQLTAVSVLLVWTQFAWAQSFSSGSTGADGALNLTNSFNTITVRPGGIYNYTTVNITGSVTYVRNTDNSPVTILATGDVNISGTITLTGSDGAQAGFGSGGPNIGGTAGPGGFNGGNSGYEVNSPPTNIQPTAGQGPGGGGQSIGAGGQGGTYGAPSSFVVLTPLFGGSGGGGGRGSPNTSAWAGSSGGGGGGAILIASSTRIIINGRIVANGGNAQLASNTGAGCTAASGPGSGGAIRLVAPEISGTGNLTAVRGNSVACGQANASDGRIRLEAFTRTGFTGTTNPIASVANSPGAVSPASNPQLTNVPTLAITSIGGVAVPGSPTASYFAPDIALAAGTANPVTVALAATNTPVGSPTVITVKLMPQGSPTSVNVASTDHTGTFANSTASANVTLPVGQVSVLQAFAAMTLTGQTASLFPLIDGEPVERVMVAAAPGERSSVSLVTKSGREIRVDDLTAEDQLRVARAWDALRDLN